MESSQKQAENKPVTEHTLQTTSKNVPSLYDAPTPSTSKVNEHEFVVQEDQEVQQKSAANLNEKLKQQLSSAEPSTSSYSNTTQLAAVSGSEVSSLKKYQVRSGTVDRGRDYEQKIAALLSLRCILLGVEDLWLATNAEGVGAFDDIILHVKRPNSGGITFMFQLKHKDKPKNILQSEFLSPKGDFSLSKYFKDIEVLHESIHSDKKVIEIVENLGSFHNIHFVLYSNRKTNNCDFLEKYSDTNLNFFNTSDDFSNLYRVNVKKMPENTNFSEIIARANFYLLSNQVNATHLDNLIVNEITKINNTLELSKLNNKDVAEGFIKHIVAWAKGDLGGHFYLTKQDIVYKLTELFLRQYALNFKEESFHNHENEKIAIWNQITSHQTITLVNHGEIASKFLIQYLSNEVHNCSGQLINNWEEQLSQKQQQLFYETQTHLKDHMLKSIGFQGKISPYDIYKSMWRNNQLPLLLKVSNSQHYRNIVNVLKLSEYLYKIVILHENTELPPKEENVNYFETLKDLQKEERNKILEQKVKLQGRPGAVLKDLINQKSYQYIKCADILNILSDSFNIGKNLYSLPDYFVGRIIIKTVIKPEVLEKHDEEEEKEEKEEEIFLIDGAFEMLPESVRKYNISKIEDVRFDIPSSIPEIINIQGDLNSNQLQQLKSKNQPIHILSVYDENHFHLKWSSKFTQTIQRNKTELTYALRREEIQAFLQNTAIIYGVPGMGKTTLMDYVANEAPIDKWVLRIDLNKHQSYFRTSKCNTSTTKAQEHLDHFYDAIYNNSTDSQLCRNVFQNFVTSKNVIALLDGFDEIAVSYKEEVTNIAEALRQEGYTVCITTRPLMKEHLEQVFQTTSDTLQPFTKEDQEDFLVKYYNAVHKDFTEPNKLYISTAFVHKLLQAARINLNDRDAEFTGIPLQTTLLAKVFKEECGKCISNNGVNNFNPDFDLPFLYENFIDIYLKKHGDFAYNVYKDIKIDQSLFALQLIFPEKFFTDTSIMNNLNDAYRNSEKRKQQLEQVGIIFLDETLNISCIHRTVAEYLSAEWLIENCTATDREIKELASCLIKARFSGNYGFLFHIFDKMATKGCPLHWAIINGEYEKGIKILNENHESDDKIDKIGRSALHVVTLNKLNGFWSTHIIHSDREKGDRMVYMAKQILEGSTVRIHAETDVIGCNELDYALITASLETANNIQEKLQTSVINIYIDLLYTSKYLKHCSKYLPKLFHLLLPYFISRDLILANVPSNITVKGYTKKIIKGRFNKLIIKKYQGMTTLQMLQSELGLSYSGYITDSNPPYYTDLRYAIIFGSEDNVEELLQEDSQINKSDLDDNVPLHYAVLHGKQKIVQLLLNKSPRINKQNRKDGTPLHLALKKGYTNIAELIISKGGEVNARNNKGDTLLHYVRDKNIAELIISKGGEVNARNKKGDTPLISSLISTCYKTVAKLIISKGGEVNSRNKKGGTPLHYVCDKNIAELIISKGGEVNARNKKGDTPLHSVRDKNIAELIISKGGDVNAKNNDGDTPLHSTRNKNIAELIISKGGDVNAKNNNGDTPLHSTRIKNIAELIISKGGGVNARNNDGNTPLHSISSKNIAKLLIAKGGEVNARNNNGDTPLHSARKKNITELIISKGGEVNARNNDGNTPLHSINSKNIAKLIIAKGGKVNARNNNGDTPLNSTRSKNIAELIISKGGEVNARNNNGDTPLHSARNENIAKLIIAKGAELNIRNNDGQTPLDVALAKGWDDVVQLLSK